MKNRTKYWLLLFLPVVGFTAAVSGCGGGNDTVPSGPTTQTALSAVTVDSGSAATFVNSSLPASSGDPAPSASTNGGSLSFTPGSPVTLGIDTTAPVDDILVSVGNQPGYFDVPVGGATRQSTGTPSHYTVRLTFTTGLNQFILHVATRRAGVVSDPVSIPVAPGSPSTTGGTTGSTSATTTVGTTGSTSATTTVGTTGSTSATTTVGTTGTSSATSTAGTTGTSSATSTAGTTGSTGVTTGGSFTILDAPGAMYTSPHAINDSGQIVGQVVGSSAAQSFLLSGGAYTTFDPPGGRNSEADGINVSGEIVGAFQDDAGEHGYLLKNGVYTTLNDPAGSFTTAKAINTSGEIVGWYLDSNNNQHSFLLSNGVYTTIDPPNAAQSIATGINDSGQIVGSFTDSGNVGHGYLLSSGTYSTLNHPSAGFTAANGINNSGEIVGSYTVNPNSSGGAPSSNTVPHAFVLDSGMYVTVDRPGVLSAIASGINSSGQIVGRTDNTGIGIGDGFLFTPLASR